MKTSILIAAGLLWPALTFADVSVRVNVGDHHDHDQEYEESSWYEECESHGPFQQNIEYQWCFDNGGPVLRFRTVMYNVVFRTWTYAPWQIKVEYCHPSCHRRHEHHYYSHGCRIGHKKSKHHRHDSHCGYRVYSYEPRYQSRTYNRYERNDRGYRDHNYNAPARKYEQQEPVRRPSVRPVPGSNVTGSRYGSQDQSTSTRTASREVVQLEQSTMQKKTADRKTDSNRGSIQKTSERTRIW